jgi:transcriptional regulator with XRE-family HTH domain
MFCKKFEWIEHYEVIRKGGVTILVEGTLWRIENGFSEVRPQTIRKFAGILGVEPNQLVEREE